MSTIPQSVDGFIPSDDPIEEDNTTLVSEFTNMKYDATRKEYYFGKSIGEIKHRKRNPDGYVYKGVVYDLTKTHKKSQLIWQILIIILIVSISYFMFN